MNEDISYPEDEGTLLAHKYEIAVHHVDILLVKKQEKVNAVMDTIRAQLIAIDEECDSEIDEAVEVLNAAEEKVRAYVLDHKSSAIGHFKRISYVKEKWMYSDTYKHGYEPCTAFRKKGNPTTRIT